MSFGVIGVDVGEKRVGVAGIDPTGVIATPLVTLERNARDFWQKLGEICREREADLAVIGLPRGMDGSEGAATAMARKFAAEMEERLKVTIEFWDERLTSREAERSMIESGMRRRERRETIDAVAASLMLSGWLQAHRNSLTP